jgi:hypothetical protein
VPLFAHLVAPFWHGGWFKADWTHEAHIAVLTYLLRERPDIDLNMEIGFLWRASNEAMGIENTDSAGYHHSITLTYLKGIRGVLAVGDWPNDLCACVNALLAHPVSQRGYPLTLYSEDQLFSVAARRQYIEPYPLSHQREGGRAADSTPTRS